MDGLFALPGQLLENGPARRIGESPEHVIGIGRLHTRNHSRMVMVCQERKATQFPIAALRGTNLSDCALGEDAMGAADSKRNSPSPACDSPDLDESIIANALSEHRGREISGLRSSGRLTDRT